MILVANPARTATVRRVKIPRSTVFEYVYDCVFTVKIRNLLLRDQPGSVLVLFHGSHIVHILVINWYDFTIFIEFVNKLCGIITKKTFWSNGNDVVGD